MFAPKTEFPIFGAALPFSNTIITNYCFSAILKGLKLNSSSSAVNTSQFDNCQSFCCHVCPKNKISDFWLRSTLSKYNYYKLLLFCNFKRFEAKQFFYSNQSLEINLSSFTAVNTSQFDNCQQFRCHVCPENEIYEFWRRSTFSKYNYYKLLLFCNFKRFEAEQFFFSGQYLTVWTIVSRSVVMFAPKTKFPSFDAALPFPNTNITNYCFSAILKGLKHDNQTTGSCRTVRY